MPSPLTPVSRAVQPERPDDTLAVDQDPEQVTAVHRTSLPRGELRDVDRRLRRDPAVLISDRGDDRGDRLGVLVISASDDHASLSPRDRGGRRG